MPGPRCSVCSHEQVQEIDRRLVGSSPPNYSALARTFGLDHEAVSRHHKSHLPALLVKAGNLAEITSAEWIVTTIRTGLSELEGVVARCKAKGDERTVVAAVKAQSTLLNTVVGAAALVLEERARAAEISPEARLSLDEVETMMRARIDREVSLRTDGHRSRRPPADPASPPGPPTQRLAVSAPGHLALPGNPPEHPAAEVA